MWVEKIPDGSCLSILMLLVIPLWAECSKPFFLVLALYMLRWHHSRLELWKLGEGGHKYILVFIFFVF